MRPMPTEARAPGADEAARPVPNLLRSVVLKRVMTKGRMRLVLAWVVRLQTVLGVWPGVSVAYPRGERHSSGLAGHVILLLIRAEGNGLG